MLWTLTLFCKSRNVLKQFTKLIPVLVQHCMSENPEIQLQSLIVLAAISYEFDSHPHFLKYHILIGLIKIRCGFLIDDIRYLPLIIILSNLSANTSLAIPLSLDLVCLSTHLIEIKKYEDIQFQEACKALANLSYLPHFDVSWIADE